MKKPKLNCILTGILATALFAAAAAALTFSGEVKKPGDSKPTKTPEISTRCNSEPWETAEILILGMPEGKVTEFDLCDNQVAKITALGVSERPGKNDTAGGSKCYVGSLIVTDVGSGQIMNATLLESCHRSSPVRDEASLSPKVNHNALDQQ